MDTAQALTQRLRQELGYPRLVAAADPSADRWCVYEIRRRCSPGWEVPYSLSDAGEVRGGVSTVREVRNVPELIYVHEAPGGGYAPPEVHVILAALRKQDRWAARDVAGDMVRRVQANRARRAKAASDHFADLAGDTRREMQKAAEELGL